MAWIKFSYDLVHSPQMTMLARRLGIPQARAIGHVLGVLWWCVENTEDGHLETRDPRILASAGLWEGDPEVFVQALIQTGWIALTEKGFQVCRWEDYAGPVIERRLENHRRQVRARARKHGLTEPGQGKRHA
jgi:hypothetical protein